MNTILITGVSTGIGRATAVYFLEKKNWNVYGSVRKSGDAGDLGKDPNFHELVFDVTDRPARQKELARITANGHALSILVNNAGIAPSGPLEVMPAEDIRQQFEVNVFGALETTQDALPQLHATREKEPELPVRIINVTSVSGIVTSPFTSLYSASKFALESLTDGLRRELLPFNIDCVSVAPGPVKTPIWRKALGREHLYEGTRYDFILDKLESYVSNAEKGGIPAKVVAEAIFAAAIAERPKTFKLLMAKSWPVKLLGLLPTRTVDKLIWKNINNAKRY